jgi:hypothetical protein
MWQFIAIMAIFSLFVVKNAIDSAYFLGIFSIDLKDQISYQ